MCIDFSLLHHASSPKLCHDETQPGYRCFFFFFQVTFTSMREQKKVLVEAIFWLFYLRGLFLADNHVVLFKEMVGMSFNDG